LYVGVQCGSAGEQENKTCGSRQLSEPLGRALRVSKEVERQGGKGQESEAGVWGVLLLDDAMKEQRYLS